MKVLIPEKIHDDGIALLQKYVEVECRFGITQQEFAGIIDQYEAVVIRGLHYLDKTVIDRAVKLKVIGVNAIGLSIVDVDYAKEKGIGVYNVPDGSIDAVAELTMALMLNLVRKVHGAVNSVMSEGKWDKHSFTGIQLKDKVLGIVSLGKIGSRVACLAQAFDMKVIAFDPYMDSAKAAELGVELVKLGELMSRADIVSVHSPLTKETHHLIGKEQLRGMKNGAYLVSIGRGGVVDEESLYEALKSGHLAGAALDVLEKEPPKANKLFALDNLICTPHIGGSAMEAQKFISKSIAEKVLRHLGLMK